MKYIHIADVHLGKKVQNCICCGSEEEHTEKYFKKFEEWISTISSENILLIAGDLIEYSEIDYNYIIRLEKALNNCKAYKIYIACGNHDPYYIYKEMKLNQNIHIFSPFNIEMCIDKDKKHVICGQSFFNMHETNDCNFDKIKYIDGYKFILVLHGDYPKTISEYRPINRFPAFFDYIALGHIHKGEKFNKNIIYAGAFMPQTFKDLEPTGLIEVEINDLGNIRINRKNILNKIFKTIEIDLNNITYDKIPYYINSVNEKESINKGYLKIKLINKYCECDLKNIREQINGDYDICFTEEKTKMKNIDDDNYFWNHIKSEFDNYCKNESIDKEMKRKINEYLYKIHKEVL